MHSIHGIRQTIVSTIPHINESYIYCLYTWCMHIEKFNFYDVGIILSWIYFYFIFQFRIWFTRSILNSEHWKISWWETTSNHPLGVSTRRNYLTIIHLYSWLHLLLMCVMGCCFLLSKVYVVLFTLLQNAYITSQHFTRIRYLKGLGLR